LDSFHTPRAHRRAIAPVIADLFDDVEHDHVEQHYPLIPGAKVPGASREAARRIKRYANSVRDRVLDNFREAHPEGWSADEVANLIGVSILTVRPRVSELKADGMLEPISDERATNSSGMSAQRLRATAKALQEARS
jgi:DNA-directed RNA polymerase specialized sigma24 family protein